MCWWANHIMVKSASSGFQFFPPTGVVELVRNRNLEEWQVPDEIGQPEGQVWASAQSIKDSCDKPINLPLDVLQYYQSLFLPSVCVEKETGAYPAVTRPRLDQPLPATFTTFQVGQGHKGAVELGEHKICLTKKFDWGRTVKSFYVKAVGIVR